MARGRSRKNKKEEQRVQEEVVQEQIEEQPVEEVTSETEQEVKEKVEVKEEQVEEVKEKPKKEVKRQNNTLQSILKESKSVPELLSKLKETDEYKNIADRLERFRTNMLKEHTDAAGIGYIYDFYVLLNSILNEENYGKFKEKFDIINKLFQLGKNDVFNPLTLSRYDYKWRWGNDNRLFHLYIVEVIGELSDPNKRKAAKKTIDFNNSTMNRNETVKQNILRYYGI